MAALLDHVLALADDALVLGHRTSEWCRFAPTHEEDLALANIGLDLIGQARLLYTLAADIENENRSENSFAYHRDANEFKNLLINELPNGDFAFTMARLFLVSAFMLHYWQAVKNCKEPRLAAIAMRAEKEVAYHLRHAGDWVLRLGDGTPESRRRLLAAFEALWPWVPEMFANDKAEKELVKKELAPDRTSLRAPFDKTVATILREINLARPTQVRAQTGGREGSHTEHLAALLAEMQVLARQYPEAAW